ncbi:MAG: dTMP kinase [Candidatus Adiutrix sp.]|jgi:TatD DNase family protein|nr:dTMP kinase [Candidatus Adiutrix sp.]
MMDYKKEIGLRAPGVNRGFFIALEGLDGVGKTTLARRLSTALAGLGLNPLEVKEPTEGPWGRQIRELARAGRRLARPEEELDLFVRDRAEDVEQNIGPALLAGRPVVADRYILSNVAYQSSLGISEKTILAANARFPWPDLMVILEAPVATGLARIAAGRPEGPNQAFEAPAYLEKVKTSFDRQNYPSILRLDARSEPGQLCDRVLAELGRAGFLADRPEIIDSHCHLSMKDFQDDLGAVLARARAVGVRAMLNVGLGPENSRQVLAMAETEPDLRPVVGWHPHEADDFSPAGFREIIRLAGDPRVAALGEIGLDFHLMHSSRAGQLKVFESFLEAATGLDRPVVIHSREAFAETYELINKYAQQLKRGGVIHCFAKGWDEAVAWLDLGFYLSLPGVLTFPKNPDLREAVARIPADRLLVETDAPYLAPVPWRGRRNEPAHLVYHLQTLAEIRGLTLAQAAALTTANARRLFHLGPRS